MKSIAMVCTLLLTCALWGQGLPDAPSAQSAGTVAKATSDEPAPPSPLPVHAHKMHFSEGHPDRNFWLATGVLFGASVANVEMVSRCEPQACQQVPTALRSRGALYGVSLPVDIGVSYLSYKLRGLGRHSWWSAPMAIITSGNAIYAIHASRYSR
jgi:hypothetical protein